MVKKRFIKRYYKKKFKRLIEQIIRIRADFGILIFFSAQESGNIGFDKKLQTKQINFNYIRENAFELNNNTNFYISFFGLYKLYGIKIEAIHFKLVAGDALTPYIMLSFFRYWSWLIKMYVHLWILLFFGQDSNNYYLIEVLQK